MNNYERFYYETDIAIKLMYNFLNSDSQNHEHGANKVLKTLEQLKIDPASLRFSLTSLIDITSFALNKEKIEHQVNFDWDNYKAEITSKLNNFEKRYSKIPYFKEWLQVSDCAEKYKTEHAKFWIKKVRDAFLHGKFELDYSKNSPYSEIKINQGSATRTDVSIKIYEPGLTEFIEDNFRNIYNDGCGIKDFYTFLEYPDVNITDFDSLEKYIKSVIVRRYTIDYDNFTYDGITFNSADGQKFKPLIIPRQVTEISGSTPKTPDFLIQSGYTSTLKPEKANLLAKIIDKKSGYIYNSGRKKDIVHKFFSNYSFTNESINSLLQEIVSVNNYVYFAVDQKCVPKSNYKKSFALIDYFKDNLKPTFTLLQLYRFSYRLQNSNFKPIDYTKLDCEKLFLNLTPELMEERITKTLEKLPSVTRKEATNRAYIEVIRDALAHGNVTLETRLNEDLSTMDKVFVFIDAWTDKLGNYTETKLETNVGCLEYLFTEIDKDLDFLPYKDLDV